MKELETADGRWKRGEPLQGSTSPSTGESRVKLPENHLLESPLSKASIPKPEDS